MRKRAVNVIERYLREKARISSFFGKLDEYMHAGMSVVIE